jgi:hypothetical protein
VRRSRPWRSPPRPPAGAAPRAAGNPNEHQAGGDEGRTGRIAQAMVEEALRLPDAVEDAAALSAARIAGGEPAVQAAKAEAEAARAAFAMELARLKESGAAALDIKAKIRGLPAAVAADPRKALGIGAAGVGAVAVARGLRRGRRKPAVPGLLPPEVEAALGDAAGDTEKVREARRRLRLPRGPGAGS